MCRKAMYFSTTTHSFCLGECAYQSWIIIRAASHLEMLSLGRNIVQVTFLLLL